MKKKKKKKQLKSASRDIKCTPHKLHCHDLEPKELFVFEALLAGVFLQDQKIIGE